MGGTCANSDGSCIKFVSRKPKNNCAYERTSVDVNEYIFDERVIEEKQKILQALKEVLEKL